MIHRTRRWSGIALLGTTLSGTLMAGTLILVLPGCASKGYVNAHIEALRQDFRAETTRLDNSTESAMNRASTAFSSAEEAHDLALGKAGLEEVGRYTVYFAFDSDQLDASAEALLDRAAQDIRSRPEAIVDVYGFADPTGTDAYNLDLGWRRASEVVRYLIAADEQGRLSRYAAVSYGERDLHGMTPEYPEDGEARRVVVSLVHRVPLDEMLPPSAQVTNPEP